MLRSLTVSHSCGTRVFVPLAISGRMCDTVVGLLGFVPEAIAPLV